MALDGVKILDGDLAHDAYAAVLAAVQAGQPGTAIRKAFPLLPRKKFDDLDNELYLTSTALAYWESGLLSASDVADLETKVWSLFNEKDWVGLFGASEGKKRKTQLQALFKKLGKPHAVAEPKPIEGIFREDQAYAFALGGGLFGAFLCVGIEYVGSKISRYSIVFFDYQGPLPRLDDLKNARLQGGFVASAGDRSFVARHQPGVERLWQFAGNETLGEFGLHQNTIRHTHLLDIGTEAFVELGRIQLQASLKAMKSSSVLEALEHFQEDLEIALSAAAASRKELTFFPVSLLVDAGASG
ncbi:hypothetical protein NB717_002509 [Xanthomonas sacchari]|uniref:hypothetical protein n=1 Tax=Xanthomonas TaxID=338 RepID=UPI00225DEC6F|nr:MULTISPECIES: hypothetical protein [Xanthomonas]MCW0461441.1 hypothetical protein [Xanthomonas sacchari]MDY4295644.1 hypothetical protein [Xanthomonas sp. LF02-5]MDY4357438.1 hypothetical protein [Xanthomonas sp. LF04-12]